MPTINQLIATKFDKVATNYLDHANVQSSPALKIASLIPSYYDEHDLPNQGPILDLGSGPGTLKHISNHNYPLLNFDLSYSMLKNINHTLYKVNGDAHYLPFISNYFPLIISNMMLQWPNNKAKVLTETTRVLAKNGILILSCLIKPSLHELQKAWLQVDNKPHTISFLGLSDYVSLITQAGLNIVHQDMWSNTYNFASLDLLLKHFKLTGTSLTKSLSNLGLGGKEKLVKLEKAYQKLVTINGLPLTYTYLLIIAKKL